MVIIEIVLWVMFIASFLLRAFLHLDPGILLFAGVSLSSFYLFCSFFIFNKVSPVDFIFNKKPNISGLNLMSTIFPGFVYSFICMTILFNFLGFPGSKAFIVMSTALLIANIFNSKSKARKVDGKDNLYYRIFKRNVFMLVIMFLLAAPAYLLPYNIASKLYKHTRYMELFRPR
jgi:hypothetical protein